MNFCESRIIEIDGKTFIADQVCEEEQAIEITVLPNTGMDYLNPLWLSLLCITLFLTIRRLIK